MQWHKTAWPVKVGPIDARPFVLVLFLPLHLRIWSILTVLVVITFFGLLAWRGLTLPVLYRRLKHRASGTLRTSRPWWYWCRWRPQWWQTRFQL